MQKIIYRFKLFSKVDSNNLFVTSKNETTNLPIYELKVLHKGKNSFKTPF